MSKKRKGAASASSELEHSSNGKIYANFLSRVAQVFNSKMEANVAACWLAKHIKEARCLEEPQKNELITSITSGLDEIADYSGLMTRIFFESFISEAFPKAIKDLDFLKTNSLIESVRERNEYMWNILYISFRENIRIDHTLCKLFSMNLDTLDKVDRARRSDLKDFTKEKIVFVTVSQFVNEKHSPTLASLLIATSLQKLGYSPTLIVVRSAPEQCSLPFIRPFTMRQNIKDYTIFNFRGHSIPILPIDFSKENISFLESVIFNFEPIFNVQVGGFNIHAELISKRVKTFLWTTTPLTTPSRYSRIVSIQDELSERSKSALISAGLPKDIYKKVFSLGTQLDGGNFFKYELAPKEALGVPENSLILAIVGNRLEFEIGKSELAFFKRLSSLFENLKILFIGSLPSHTITTVKTCLGDKAIFSGYVEDLQSVYASCDFFINMRRLGGGMSAYLALYSGILVYSINYGDVSKLIPPHFLAEDYDELSVLLSVNANHNRLRSLQLAHNIVEKDQSLTSKVEIVAALLDPLG